MARRVTFEVPTDTGQFTFLQIQPKSLLNLCWNGYARWLRQHLFSFPQLIREHGFGAVILDIDIEYLEPLTFFDTDSLEITVALRARRGGTRLELQTDYSGAGRPAAQVTLILCPVEIKDQETLTAFPARLSSTILDKFDPDEVDAESPSRQVPELVAQIEADGEALRRRTGEFFVHHHYCEVAEQWSFIEVPNIAESIREPLALEGSEHQPILRDCLIKPLKRLHVELYQPYFVYESGIVETSAYHWQNQLTFIHRLKSTRFQDNVHGIVVERF